MKTREDFNKSMEETNTETTVTFDPTFPVEASVPSTDVFLVNEQAQTIDTTEVAITTHPVENVFGEDTKPEGFKEVPTFKLDDSIEIPEGKSIKAFEGFISEYQMVARTFALPQIADNLFYMALKLGGEVGEFQEKIGKVLRDQDGQFSEEDVNALGRELGDVLWYVANLSSLFNLDLEQVAWGNIQKLQDRLNRGVIQGSGDDR